MEKLSILKSDTLIELTKEDIAYICKQEPMFKKCLKGYDGPVVSFESKGFGPMLLPNHNKIINQVAIAWASVVFGCAGSTPFDKAVSSEIAKRLRGKVYSVKKLAELVGM